MYEILPQGLFEFFVTKPYKDCVEYYAKIRRGGHTSKAQRRLLNRILGLRVIYGEVREVPNESPETPKAELENLKALYTNLQLEQCKELYLMQVPNLNPDAQVALLQLLGSKLMYNVACELGTASR